MVGRNRQGLWVIIELVLDCFEGQAYIASLYIVLNVMAKCWLVVFPGYKLTCCFDIKVVCLLIDCYDACWWALSGWFPRYKIDPVGVRLHQCCPSLLSTLPWSSEHACLQLAVFVASILCCQYWLYTNFYLTVCFRVSSKILSTRVACTFYWWELDKGAMVLKKSWALLSWHWSVNPANSERFGHF